MMLKDKVAVIYGAGGGIGSAVARAFAAEGADLFLTGRDLAPVEGVAKEVVSAADRRDGESMLSTTVKSISTRDRQRGARRHLLQRGQHPQCEGRVSL
jgi:NAD(P)-dependent dehydrogenase (short-subunit alcohol dehydrogenase family)